MRSLSPDRSLVRLFIGEEVRQLRAFGAPGVRHRNESRQVQHHHRVGEPGRVINSDGIPACSR